MPCPPSPLPPVLWSDFEVRSSGIPRVAIWAEEAPPQNKAHGPMPPPLGGSPSVGTASGSRSSQSHFRDEEAEAQAGEASRRGASCSQRGRWNRTHSHILGCAVTGLFPFSCGCSRSGIWLCPLQGWLGGAMRRVVFAGEVRVPLSLCSVGCVLPASGACAHMAELTIYHHSLGTV